jgi:AcrR family transcriptional regulator
MARPPAAPSPSPRPSAPTTPAAVAPHAEREPRGARRKRETREKLLHAAFELIARKGIDAVAINEITEHADVGFGSFYNHFESKDAIYDAVLDAVFEQFGDALEQITRDLEDPAEVVATCVRHTLGRARREPLWGSFLLREGFKPQGITRGLGARLRRDIQKGIRLKRFVVPDPLMAVLMTGGGVMAAIAAELAVSEGGAALAERLGFDVRNVETRATVAVLLGLGVREEDARRIVKRPLPPFEAHVPGWDSAPG